MKKFLSVILAITLIFMSVPSVFGAKYKDYEYTTSNNTVTITAYNNFTANAVTIPSQIDGKNVVAIGNGAFQLKSNITSVIIPDTVTAIGQMAFYNCANLKKVTLGSGVKSIGAKAFNTCKSLTQIKLNNTETVGEYAFYGCTSLTDLYLNNTKVIGKNAFAGCKALSTVRMSSKLLYIDQYAFSNCISIKTLSLPDELGFIGNSAFKGCSALTNLNFGTGDLQIDSYAFESCTSLTEVEIPDNVIAIGRYAFAIRPDNSTDFSHIITITCNHDSAAAKYVKLYNAPAVFSDFDVEVELFGDIDGDGKLTTKDARKILRVAAMQTEPLNDYETFVCDINSNDVIDTEDCRLILRRASGLD